MRTVKLSGVFLVCFCVVMITGCASEQAKDMKIQNDTQRKRIGELESESQANKLRFEQAQRELEALQSSTSTEVGSMQQTLQSLQEDLEKKKSLIASMQQQLLYGGAQLPVELTTMLDDFARNQEMVTYDSNQGIVKFKSDLLFEPGSDKVMPAAAEAIKTLSIILGSEQAKNFDIVIAGHTDDMIIGKFETRQKHPTNWHLSAHRAISVLNIMTENNIAPERISVRGFGEFRPIEPNTANKKGNPQNRRVEIYIVPKGV